MAERLALGLCGIADYETQQPFLNVMKAGRAWQARSETNFNFMSNERMKQEGFLTVNDYPNAVPPGANRVGTIILCEIPKEDVSLNGRYTLTYNGTGDVNVHGGRNTVYGVNRVEFDFIAQDTNMISVEFSRITVPISNMACVRNEDRAAWSAGAFFRPSWLEVVKGFDQYRFMDWQQTNHSKVRTWADRPKPNDFTYTKGVPVEVMVRLCNLMKVDPWFCYPHLADDNYMRLFAEYVRDRLDPALVASYEFSNEVWNFIFGQAHWADAEAEKLWPGDDTGWMQIYGGRSAEMAQILNSVYAANLTQFRKVISTHTSWIDLSSYALNAPKWVAQVPGRKAPKTYFDDYAVTGYFGHNLKTSDVQTWRSTLTEAQAFERMRVVLNNEITGLIATWGEQEKIAQANNLNMVMYEGGSHVNVVHSIIDSNPGLLEFIEKFHYSPVMASLYNRAMLAFEAAGGKQFNVFVDVAAPGRHGFWGAQRWVGDINPRWNAVATYNGSADVVVPEQPNNPTPQPTPETPSMATIKTFTYQNSLFDHQYGPNKDDDTRVPNWTWRMAQAAGNVYEAVGDFGFAVEWTLPPRSDDMYEDVTVPAGISGWTQSWTGMSNINLVTFVPDNFDSFGRAPDVNSTNPGGPLGSGQNYKDRILQMIDAWERNAPNPNRRYTVYAGWADFNSRSDGGQWNTYTAAQLNTYLTWSYGGYHKWYTDLVAMLKTARPNLKIELLDVQRVMMKTWRNTALNTLTGSRLWEDNSPHGTETWYLLAAIVYYMEIFGSKPPANYNPLSGKGQGSGVSSVMINNWSSIVDYAWNELGNTATTPVPVEPTPTPTEPTPTPEPTPTGTKPQLKPQSPEFWTLSDFGDGKTLVIDVKKLEVANPPLKSIRFRQNNGSKAWNLVPELGLHSVEPDPAFPMLFSRMDVNDLGGSPWSDQVEFKLSPVSEPPVEPDPVEPTPDPEPVDPRNTAIDQIVIDLAAVADEIDRINAEIVKLKA